MFGLSSCKPKGSSMMCPISSVASNTHETISVTNGTRRDGKHCTNTTGERIVHMLKSLDVCLE